MGVECFSEIGGGLIVDVSVVANPRTLPVLHSHHSGLEAVDVRSSLFAVLIPYIHFPVIFGKGLKILFRIGDKDF